MNWTIQRKFKKLRFRQHDSSDCGPACLASVAKFYRRPVSISTLRRLANTDQEGTSLKGLITAAQASGFASRAVKTSVKGLQSITHPSIAHTIKDGFLHYVVVCQATDTSVTVMDPADGELTRLLHREFLQTWTGILLMLENIGTEKSQPSFGSFRDRVKAIIDPHTTAVVVMILAALIYALTGVGWAICVQNIFDKVSTAREVDHLEYLFISMAGLLMIQTLSSFLKGHLAILTGQQINFSLIQRYVDHFLRLPQTYHNSMRVGDSVSRITDAMKMSTFIHDLLTTFLVSLSAIILSVILLSTYYWKLGVACLILIPLYALIHYVSSCRTARNERNVIEGTAKLEAALVETFSFVSTSKIFQLEERLVQNVTTRLKSLLQAIRISGRNSLFTGLSSEFVSRLWIIILLSLGIELVVTSKISIGELISFYTVVLWFTSPVGQVISFNKTYQNARVSAERYFDVLNLQTEGKTLPDSYCLRSDIKFTDVSFRYGNRLPLFNKVSFTIPASQITVFVGDSGSGKSTLTSLLLNLYPIDEGKIMIGDHDIHRLSVGSLRCRISVVPQKIELFSGSIMENITALDEHPDRIKAERLCEELGIDEFIRKLPNKFDTQLGEFGTQLSGGQKQRIAIARALYKDHDILILDEATSALDAQAQGLLIDAIRKEKSEGKTVVIIAHNSAMMTIADNVITMGKTNTVPHAEELSLTKSDYSAAYKPAALP